MKVKKIKKIIKREKFLLNLLLRFISPTNSIAVLLSTKLDKHIFIYQNHLYKKYKRKRGKRRKHKLVA